MIIVRELAGKQMTRACSRKSLLEMIKKEADRKDRSLFE